MPTDQPPPVVDRRHHQRQAGSDFPRNNTKYQAPDGITVAGRPARLVDWSFGGLGLQLERPDHFEVNTEVELRVYDLAQESWESLSAQIRRIEADGTLGLAFEDDGENNVRILLRLLNNRLIHIMS